MQVSKYDRFFFQGGKFIGSPHRCRQAELFFSLELYDVFLIEAEYKSKSYLIPLTELLKCLYMASLAGAVPELSGKWWQRLIQMQKLFGAVEGIFFPENLSRVPKLPVLHFNGDYELFCCDHCGETMGFTLQAEADTVKMPLKNVLECLFKAENDLDLPPFHAAWKSKVCAHYHITDLLI